jgi:hypothetical protein
MGYLMRVEEKRNLIKHIKLGTSEVLYYPYTEGKQPLPLRPISSWELDDCFYRALNNTPDKIADFIVKVKLDLIDRKTNINVENSGYVKLMRFYNEIDYWIVYYAMKDFQDSEFSVNNFDTGEPYGINIVKKMLDVHKISKFVLTASYQPKEIIKEIIRDEQGRFAKGFSGNPDGRPPEGESLTAIISEYLAEKDEEYDIERKRVFAIKLYEKIKSGDVSAMRLLMSYTDGLPTQRFEGKMTEQIVNHPQYIAIKNLYLKLLNKHPEDKEEALEELENIDDSE